MTAWIFRLRCYQLPHEVVGSHALDHFFGVTIKSRLDSFKGIGPGFDLLRIGLAFAIFYGHTLWVAGGNHPSVHTAAAAARAVAATDGGGWTGPKRPLHVALVPMFFALSGFLVMGSAFRLRDVRTFLAFRALRLFPALIVEVTLSALVLGAAFTTLPRLTYFTNGAFFRYFGNVAGQISFKLPGVFESNPVSGMVNANLWTLPAELDCYILASILLISGLLFRRTILTIIFVVVAITFVGLNGFSNFAVTYQVLAGHTITFYFMVGVMFYVWQDRIPFNIGIFAVSALCSYVFLMLHHTIYLASPFVAYCTIYIGLLSLPKIKLLSSGDYSYGLYLYGFPISQAVVALFPSIIGHGWLNVLVSTALSFGFAAFSWHLIEKRALTLKRHLPARYFPMRARIVVTPTEVISVPLKDEELQPQT
jgi:peptidoglycan/LPS O-acetylase OafA/YrhL